MPSASLRFIYAFLFLLYWLPIDTSTRVTEEGTTRHPKEMLILHGTSCLGINICISCLKDWHELHLAISAELEHSLLRFGIRKYLFRLI